METSKNYSDKATFGIKDGLTRYTWTTYCIFIFLASLIGDITILIAAIKYQAFKLHKFIVVIMEHIAVCDLMISFFDVLARIIALIANKWVMGQLCCLIVAYSRYYFNTVSAALICILAFCKLLIMKHPRQSKIFSSKNAHIVCTCAWFYSLGPSIVISAVESSNVLFDYRGYACNFMFSESIWKWLIPVCSILFIGVPNFIVMIVTILLLFHLSQAKRIAQRAGRNFRWKGIACTITVGAVYITSFLPYAIFRIIEVSLSDYNEVFHVHTLRITLSLMNINIISNFFIYSLTVPSFRHFLLFKVEQLRERIVTINNILSTSRHEDIEDNVEIDREW